MCRRCVRRRSTSLCGPRQHLRPAESRVYTNMSIARGAGGGVRRACHRECPLVDFEGLHPVAFLDAVATDRPWLSLAPSSGVPTGAESSACGQICDQSGERTQLVRDCTIVGRPSVRSQRIFFIFFCVLGPGVTVGQRGIPVCLLCAIINDINPALCSILT